MNKKQSVPCSSRGRDKKGLSAADCILKAALRQRESCGFASWPGSHIWGITCCERVAVAIAFSMGCGASKPEVKEATAAQARPRPTEPQVPCLGLLDTHELVKELGKGGPKNHF